MHAFSLTLLCTLPLLAAEPWPNPPGRGRVLGVAADGAAWSVRFVLPVAESENHQSCGYPAVKGTEPAAVTLALCRKDTTCDTWPVYDLQSCTPHDQAAQALERAKAAWTEAGVPWDAPVSPIDATDNRITLPSGTLKAQGVSGVITVSQERTPQDDGTSVQHTVFSAPGHKPARFPVATYGEYEGAMSWLWLERLTVLSSADVMVGFLEGGCCGSDLLAVEPVVFDMKSIAEAMGAQLPDHPR